MAAQDYEQVTYNGPAGAQIGKSATEKVAFYGAVPVVQRPYSSAVHATSALASSSDLRRYAIGCGAGNPEDPHRPRRLGYGVTSGAG
jgi:hypothetical protein